MPAAPRDVLLQLLRDIADHLGPTAVPVQLVDDRLPTLRTVRTRHYHQRRRTHIKVGHTVSMGSQDPGRIRGYLPKLLK